MSKPVYVFMSSADVLDELVRTSANEYRAIDKFKLLQERCSRLNPNAGFPFIYLEPCSMYKKLDRSVGERLVLGAETTDEEAKRFLLGFIDEDPPADTLIWFRSPKGYDWSKHFPELQKLYDLRTGDLVLDPREISSC